MMLKCLLNCEPVANKVVDSRLVVRSTIRINTLRLRRIDSGALLSTTRLCALDDGVVAGPPPPAGQAKIRLTPHLGIDIWRIGSNTL